MKHLIKSLMTVFVVVSMILCFAGISSAYTYDSEIDPVEFVGWEVVDKIPTSQHGGIAILKNPDANARIKGALVEIFSSSIVAYEYTIEGKTYRYEFNNETHNYDLVVPEVEQEVIPES